MLLLDKGGKSLNADVGWKTGKKKWLAVYINCILCSYHVYVNRFLAFSYSWLTLPHPSSYILYSGTWLVLYLSLFVMEMC